MNQLPLREHVANERRRLKSVRESLSAAVAQGAGNSPDYVPFYLAVADYMDAAMHRLHIQDVRMVEMIRSKLGVTDTTVQKELAELDERLEGNQRHLREFLEGRERLRQTGVAALPQFEKVSRDYTGYIVANMGHHGASTKLAQSLFSLDDWAYMAGVTEEESRREQALYEKVFAAVPKNLQLSRAH